MAGGGGGTKSPEEQQAAINAALENKALANYLYYICACASAAIIIWRVWTVIVKYVRTVACLNNDNQRYFAETDSKVAWLKRNVLYAPIFSKRHNREIQMSSAINVGTLPSRLQLLFLAGYLATNIAFCVINIPFAGSFSAAAGQLRNRTGTLAVVNMVCTVPGTVMFSVVAHASLHAHAACRQTLDKQTHKYNQTAGPLKIC